MPQLNLLSDSETPAQHARFWVLATMCHPDNPKARKRMVERLVEIEKAEQRGEVSQDLKKLKKEVAQLALRAGVAGSVLLNRLQLWRLGYKPYTINAALPLAKAIILHGELPGYANRNRFASRELEKPPVSGSKMRDACHRFHSVAHLWAAMIHMLEHDNLDVWFRSSHNIPRLLAFADRFLSFATSLPDPDRPKRFALARAEAWTFALPEHLRQQKDLEALALVEVQLDALHGRRLRKSLVMKGNQN